MPDNERGAFGSTFMEEGDFLKYLASRYGSWLHAMTYRTVYSFRLPQSPLYREWVAGGRPETGPKFGTGEAPTTEEDIIQEMREALTTGGQIPYQEFREQQPWLEAKGFERITEGEFGLPLPEEEQFFRRAEEVPEEIDEFGQLTEQAEQISARTGTPVADIIAALTGTPLAQMGGMSQYETEMLQFRREELGQRREISEQERVTSLRNLLTQQASQRAIARSQMSERDIYRQGQKGRSAEFEQFRQQILAGVAPRNYFIREFLRRESNPFAPKPETIDESIQNIEQSLKAEKTSLGTVRERVKAQEAKHFDLAGSGITHPPTREEFKAIGLMEELTEREDRVDRLQAALVEREDKRSEMVASGEADIIEPTPGRAAIPVPEGIKEFFPKGIGGEFIIPSARAFGRLDFASREQLLGGIQFRGGQPTDVLEDIQRMTPQRRRGGRTAPISFV